MPDVSKLSLDGTSYNIKDDAARKYVVVVNNTSQPATKVNITTSEDTVELALQSDVDAINPRITGRKIVIITDSYGLILDGETTAWTYVFKDALGLTENTNVFTVVQGGAGFANGKFLDRLQNYAPTVSGITDVLVAGGCNDYGYSESDISTAINTFKVACNTKYPNALITIATIGHTLQLSYRDAAMVQCAAYQKAVSNGIRVLIGTENILHKTNLYHTGDGVHPNSDGATEIGKYMAEAFVNGSCSVCRVEKVTLTASGAGSSIGTNAMYQSQHGNLCCFTALNRSVAFNGGITITNSSGVGLNTDYEVATFSDNAIIYGNSEMQCLIPVNGSIFYSGSSHAFSGTLKVYAGRLYVAISYVDGATPTLPSSVTVYPVGFHAAFDAMNC